MSRSDRSRLFGLTAAVLALIPAACDPAALVFDPAGSRGMWVLMILDTDTTQQEILMFTTTAGDTVRNPLARVYRDGVLVSETPPRPGTCLDRYGFAQIPSGDYECFGFDLAPRGGEVYEIVIRADDRPTARARTVVPGRFAIDSARVQGSPPGTDLVEAWWAGSEGAYRYLVGLRADEYCPFIGCGELGIGEEQNTGWFETTDATHIRTTAPYEEMYGLEGDVYVDVYAVDDALYRFLTSGNADARFPAPPVQNVENGYGVVGAWSRASITVIEGDTIGG